MADVTDNTPVLDDSEERMDELLAQERRRSYKVLVAAAVLFGIAAAVVLGYAFGWVNGSNTYIGSAVPSAPSQPPPGPARVALYSPDVEINNDFAGNLMRQLAKGGADNVVISPFSVSTALAMAYSGARGNTAAQMATALGFATDSDLHSHFGSTLSQLANASDAVTISVADRIFLQSGLQLAPAFAELQANVYQAAVQSADFNQQPETERLRINGWVANETRLRIEDLIPSGAVTDETRLVLVNALYFRGNWSVQFSPYGTSNDIFLGSDGQNHTVPMMVMSDASLNYAATPTFQAVELPYRGGEFSMVVVVPRERSAGAAQALLPELSAQWIETLDESFEATDVDLFMPKFQVEYSAMLRQPLTAMGMADAFSPTADFTGMTTTGDELTIGDVAHKTFIAVDEKGTEAAAATAVVMTTNAIIEKDPPKEVRADRPFLFLLRHRDSGAVLFLGHIGAP